MEYLNVLMKRRIEDALKSLNGIKLLIDEPSALKIDENADIDSSNGEYIFNSLKFTNSPLDEHLYDYVSNVVLKYVTSLCKGVGYDENDTEFDKIEESVESQILVEFDCVNILSQKLSTMLRSSETVSRSANLIEGSSLQEEGGTISAPTSAPSLIKLEGADEHLMCLRAYALCIELLSDLFVDGSAYIKPEEHTKLILERLLSYLGNAELTSELHIDYLKKYLTITCDYKLLKMEYLNASRPWIVYWILHSLNILNCNIDTYKERAIRTLQHCWDEEHGGYGGGYDQRAHLATTYASIATLKMLDCLDVVDSKKVYQFLRMLKNTDGTFSTNLHGESDTRGLYCAIASAHMMNILTPELLENVTDYIVQCQTYEGGISSEPGLEAHAGYTYCGAATLSLLDKLDIIDTNKLYNWCISRFTPQFGFQGRPHKLVDVCYSFWIGATIKILKIYKKDESEDFIDSLLSIYLLNISQTTSGFQDKPFKKSDLYHTCYALSYLNLSGRFKLNHKKHDINLNILT